MEPGVPSGSSRREIRLPLPDAPATRLIIIACVILQLLVLFMGAGFERWLLLSGGLIPARVTGLIIGFDAGLPMPLTFLSHIFLHGGFAHLAMNMLFLAWVGRQVECGIGSLKMLLIFLGGGIAGGLLQVLMTPTSVTPIVGASGAISAIFAAYAMLFARPGEEPANILGIRLSGETVRALRYAALWVGLQLLTAVAFGAPGSPGIAIWAHIGGFLFGLAFGLPMIRRRA